MGNESPAAILYDSSGNAVTVINSALNTTSVSSTGTITSVSAVNSDILLLASNSNRRGVFIYNDTSSATLKIGLTSSTVSTTNFSVLIGAAGLFEIPFGYTGQIRGIWSVTETNGAARITELT